MKKYKRQPALGYRRQPRGTAFSKALDAAVQKEADRWGVSKSWVIALATAEGLGVRIPKEEKY